MPSRDAPLYGRVEKQIARLAHVMLDRFVAEIPIYAMLPREQIEGEILAITDRNLRLFFSALHTGRALTEEELAEIRMSAARRAEERVPLDAVLAAYHVGGRIGWEALVENAKPAESEALVIAASRVLAYVQQVTAAVAAAYLEERQTIYGEERDALRSLASALLAGEPADGVASRIGIELAATYVVLALQLTEHSDETDRGVGGAVAARRKVRRVQQRLDSWADATVLSLLESRGGPVLLPLQDATADELLDRLPALAKELSDAAGSDVTCGAAVAPTRADVPRSWAQASDVLRLAVQLGRPAGAYQLRDVLLEYQLTRPSDAVPELAAVLAPLDRHPDLLQTLQMYVGNDLDRRGTAALLHVHPNTLDYRVRRIVDLTGIDPATSHGLQLLGAALTARGLITEPS